MSSKTTNYDLNKYTSDDGILATIAGLSANMDIIDANLGTGAGGTSDYTELENKPKINNVELTGNKTLDDLGIQTKGNYVGNATNTTKNINNIWYGTLTEYNALETKDENTIYYIPEQEE